MAGRAAERALAPHAMEKARTRRGGLRCRRPRTGRGGMVCKAHSMPERLASSGAVSASHDPGIAHAQGLRGAWAGASDYAVPAAEKHGRTPPMKFGLFYLPTYLPTVHDVQTHYRRIIAQ